MNHEGPTHEIQVPASSLVKAQYIDVSEMGLELATQSDQKRDALRNDCSQSLPLAHCKQNYNK